jgi:ribosomal protein S18 acetylase RimI-like enzyme
VSPSRPAFRIEPLGDHDRAAFSCGVEPLDRYLREQAGQDARKHAAAPFVLLTPGNRIAGYYTLSSTVILADDLPEEDIKKLKWPRHPQLPATLVGHLARDVAFRGQRLGDLLLLDALRRAFDNIGTVASPAVIVDVKDENARRFYCKYGFLSFPDAQKRLYLPMKTVERLFVG